VFDKVIDISSLPRFFVKHSAYTVIPCATGPRYAAVVSTTATSAWLIYAGCVYLLQVAAAAAVPGLGYLYDHALHRSIRRACATWLYGTLDRGADGDVTVPAAIIGIPATTIDASDTSGHGTVNWVSIFINQIKSNLFVNTKYERKKQTKNQK